MTPIRLAAAFIVMVLLGAGLVGASPAAHAQVDCATSAWEVSTTQDFSAAIACWNASTTPGAHSITLAANVDGAPTIVAKTGDYSLTIDGGNNIITQALEIAPEAFDTPPAERASPFTITNVTLIDPIATALTLDRVIADVSDIVIRDSSRALVADRSDLTLTRAHIHDNLLSNGLDTAVLIAESRAAIADTVIEDNPGGRALVANESAVVIRNTLIRNNNGAITVFEGAEVLLEQSAVIDNDVDLLFGYGIYAQGIISVINSSIVGHDAHYRSLDLGLGASPSGVVHLANSTLVDNGSGNIAGPVEVRSSLVGGCESRVDPDVGPHALELAEGPPTDLGANAGGCFSDAETAHYPLADNGCMTSTVLGCLPTIATSAASPARSAGSCTNTVIADPNFDLFTFDISSIDSAAGPAMTTTGAQLLDQRGFPRSTCDAGAFESSGIEPSSSPDLRVVSWDLAEGTCCDADDPTVHDAIAQTLVDADADLIMVQHVTAEGFSGNSLVEDVTEHLSDRQFEVMSDFAPAFVPDSNFPATFSGQAVFSRLPIVSRATTAVTHPDPADERSAVIQEVIVQRTDEPVRVVTISAFDDGTACDQINALETWLDQQPDMSTIIGASLAVETTAPCYPRLAAQWIDACQTPNADCGRTIDPAVQPDPDTSVDYIFHRPGITSPMTITRADTDSTANMPITVSAHLPIIATYSFAPGPASDLDTDAVPDATDNCPLDPNAAQTDSDTDRAGDACDPIFNGDANCDVGRDIVDALVIAQLDVGIRTDSGGCPLSNVATQAHAAAGDVNGDRRTDIVDALLIAQCAVSISNEACP